ncbi:hypothetical protein [Absidia glauca]|uniref:Subtilisin inhibitor domain-containing protein n=1 Tax=Absidia glauca TaxID=4829 RepID=A0A168LVH5_ABSGL|nr:hypothetical protein [Absidia glauca]
MMKAVLCLVFSLLVLSVSSYSVKRSFDPVIKTATIIETKDITDPDFVIPCPVKPTEETYFLYYELHGEQLVKNTLLTCDEYTPGGTHPTPVPACEEIMAIDGDSSKLSPAHCFCPLKKYDPITVNIQGKYKGNHFKFLQTFENPCIFKCVTKPIEHFVTIGLGLEE